MARKKVRNIDKRQKIAITMPPAMIKDIEEQAQLENRNRSNMICEMVRSYLLRAEIARSNPHLPDASEYGPHR